MPCCVGSSSRIWYNIGFQRHDATWTFLSVGRSSPAFRNKVAADPVCPSLCHGLGFSSKPGSTIATILSYSTHIYRVNIPILNTTSVQSFLHTRCFSTGTACHGSTDCVYGTWTSPSARRSDVKRHVSIFGGNRSAASVSSCFSPLMPSKVGSVMRRRRGRR
jgi:hypothetical protein